MIIDLNEVAYIRQCRTNLKMIMSDFLSFMVGKGLQFWFETNVTIFGGEGHEINSDSPLWVLSGCTAFWCPHFFKSKIASGGGSSTGGPRTTDSKSTVRPPSSSNILGSRSLRTMSTLLPISAALTNALTNIGLLCKKILEWRGMKSSHKISLYIVFYS